MMFSVIIPTYNNAVVLQKSLQTWGKQTLKTSEFEVIVVDNNSKDNTATVVRSIEAKYPNIHYTFESKQGATHARHCGARMAKGNWLVFADDDGLFNPTCLQAIEEAYTIYPEASAVSCKIEVLWDKAAPAWVEPYLFMYGALNYGDKIQVSKDFFFNGGLFAIKREIFEQLGGFNPDLVGSYLIGNGDTGLVHKVRDAGLKIVWTPFAMMQHMQQVDIHGSKKGLARHFYNNGIGQSYEVFRKVGFAATIPVLAYIGKHLLLWTKKMLQYYVLRKRDIKTYFALCQRRGELRFFGYLLNPTLRGEICKMNVYN